VVAARGAGCVSVLRNVSRPKLRYMAPSRGKPGTTVTITADVEGWGFGAKRGTSKVYFGSKAATSYVFWSRSTIKVRVPSMAAGRKPVTVRTKFGRSNDMSFRVL